MTALDDFDTAIRAGMRKAVPAAVSAGADGYMTDDQFWRQVRRVLGPGFNNDFPESFRVVASECALRLKRSERFPDAIALRTLQEAAKRRIRR